MYRDVRTEKLSYHLRDLSRGRDIDLEALSYFLWFGYLPGQRTLFKDVTFVPSGVSGACTVDSISKHVRGPSKDCLKVLLREGIRAWRTSVANALQGRSGQIVVPLSGGMDSRAILGELLRHFEAKSISTFTFGTPGTLDYDIAHKVARLTKTSHTSYNLQEYILTKDRLEKRAYLSNGDTDLFTQAPWDAIARDFPSDAIFWSGFMGDPTAGSHIPPAHLRRLWGDGYCLQKERYSRNIDLAQIFADGSHVELNIDLPKAFQDSDLYREELWDFQNRQMRYVISQVLPHGFTYALPFIEEQWLQFILNLPVNQRRGQKFYKLMLEHAYPNLFSLPVKGNLGLPLGVSAWRRCLSRFRTRGERIFSCLLGEPYFDKSINYIDFNSALRGREDVRAIVQGSLSDLKKRNLLRSDKIDELWLRHQAKQADCSRDLTLLASLEIILRVYKDTN